MSYVDNFNETFDLESRKEKHLPQVKEIPNSAIESLLETKKELFDIYNNAKALLLNLMDSANDVSRARDIEALSQYMRETTETLKKIKEIDAELLRMQTKSDQNDKPTTVNNFNFRGSTRDLIKFVKELKIEDCDAVQTESTEIKENSNGK